MNPLTQNSAASMQFHDNGKVDDFFRCAGPHVFFSPHADDVVLSCGGTIHSLLSQNLAVEVVGVFAGVPERNGFSAYARHLHRKWGLDGRAIEQRWAEDDAAMKELGINSVQRWGYTEAPYRTGADGTPLYLGNEELVGKLSEHDQELKESIVQAVKTYLNELPTSSVLYFPLSLGAHVDHRILFEVGLELSGSYQVQFYEDYPYAQSYDLNSDQSKWRSHAVPIVLDPKLRAACAYKSQLRGLGGTPEILKERMQTFGKSLGRAEVSERYWQIVPNGASSEPKAAISQPFVQRDVRTDLRDFGKFLKTFRWHDLVEVLPLGNGTCLDVGCGPARHRQLIEQAGYSWIGIDQKDLSSAVMRSDATSLPVSEKSVAAVVAWQVLEYVERPEALFKEAARVLEPGGVFCGSVSFLEPLHGHTYFNLSPLALEKLLSRHGFGDIQIKPGINGMALILWTWLSRSGMPFLSKFGIPLALIAFFPFAATMFFISWLWSRVGNGSGHTMRWLTQTAPLEFAGHVMFSARKLSRNRA